uniref:Uncharacterized protein n=1 Tax=Clastoptera arizonana TaxID=38151 RepID=A0A1B6EAU3_9HEMI
MLEPLRSVLNGKRIILASSSPRRAEILQNVGLKFEIIPSTYEEDLNPESFKNHGIFAETTARNKVLELSERLSKDKIKPDIIIGADTIVSLNGKIYGKPTNKSEAIKHLEMLNGREHTVFTGVVIKTPNKIDKFYECTQVFMAKLDRPTIQGYVDTNEPMDKAGSYGIQGYGGSIIERINGDYFNVMGLPLHRLSVHLINLLNT